MDLTSRVRIVVGDHQSTRHALICLLATEPDFHVVGESGHGIEIVRETLIHTPDILLLDVDLLGDSARDPLAVLAKITRRAPSVRTVLLMTNDDRGTVLSAVQCGARGVLLRRQVTRLLCESIRAVMQGQYWIDRDSAVPVSGRGRGPAGPALDHRTTANRFNLTAREMQIVNGVASCESNRTIATRLSVRVDTIKHHLSNIFDKLGVSSRVELALFAINHGLVTETSRSEEIARPTGPRSHVG